MTTLTVTIRERENGDVEVHVKDSGGYATTREGRYADALHKSIMNHLQSAMPSVVKSVLALEEKKE